MDQWQWVECRDAPLTEHLEVGAADNGGQHGGGRATGSNLNSDEVKLAGTMLRRAKTLLTYFVRHCGPPMANLQQWEPAVDGRAIEETASLHSQVRYSSLILSPLEQ